MTCNTCNECDPCDKEKKSCCDLKVMAGDCVDVEEIDGVYKVSATCPPRVVAGDGVNVKVTDSSKTGYSKDYTVSAVDKKVGVCSDDDNPGTLNEKIRVTSPLERRVVGCGTSDGYLELGLDVNALDTPDEKVAVRNTCKAGYLEDIIEIDSNLIEANTVNCKLRITDKDKEFYDNNACLGFDYSREFMVDVDSGGNSVDATWIDFWNRRTGNEKMATRGGIKILEDGYYRVFGQLTVENNTGLTEVRNRHINLGRGLLKVENELDPERKYILSTAKHGQYARQVLLRGGKGIKIDNNGEISWDEDSDGESQGRDVVQGPWMTFNMDCYIDLKKGDIITIGYRPQSNMPEANNGKFYFIFPGEDDLTTRFQAVFGGSMVGVQMITPNRFTDGNAYAAF